MKLSPQPYYPHGQGKFSQNRDEMEESVAQTYLQNFLALNICLPCFFPVGLKPVGCSATWLRTCSPLTSRAKDQPLRALWRLSPELDETIPRLLSATLLGFSNLFPFLLPTFLSLCILPPLFGFSFSLLSPLNFHFKCSPFFNSSPSSPTSYCLLFIWSSKPMSLYKPK